MALGLVRQVRQAVQYLNPDEVRHDAEARVRLLLQAGSVESMAAMQAYFCPPHLTQAKRQQVLSLLVTDGPSEIEIFDSSLPCPAHGFVFDRERPELCVRAILKRKPDWALPLARHFFPFREPVVKDLIQRVSRENAMFSLATALPDILPLISLPWAIGEFASDTAFLTMNQIRMAFMVAAASDHPVGYREQKGEIGSILAGAFGFRAVARQLVGKIPLGGGLVPKAAIAYAGTRVVGLSLAKLYRLGYEYTREERRSAFAEAFERGREVVASALRGQKRPVAS
jgi:hypothetical protein